MNREDARLQWAESVLVRVRGPDPRHIKAEGFVFYDQKGGETTLSCSGVLIGDGSVLTSASILAPFLAVPDVGGGTRGRTKGIMQHPAHDVTTRAPSLVPGTRAEIYQECRGAIQARRKPAIRIRSNPLAFGTVEKLHPSSSSLEFSRFQKSSSV
jgi:hypothetical protein